MDKAADELDAIYREDGPAVRRYLLRRMADADVADDLLQETFAVVAGDLERLGAARSPRAWLIGIARNLLREHLRAVARREVPCSPDQHAAPGEEPEDPRLEAMRQAITRLPETQREVLELRLGDELTYAEISEAMGLPIGTVRSRLHLAVAALREWASEANAVGRHDETR